VSSALLESAAATASTTGSQGLEAVLQVAGQTGVPPWILAVTLLPLVLVLLTSFARISIILAFLRQALGLQEIPSATVTTGLAALLSLVTMAPVLDSLQNDVVVPYATGELQAREALPRSWIPLSEFMRSQTRPSDEEVFLDLLEERGVEVKEDAWQIAVPAFVLSELKSGFQIGLIIWLPFLVVDLIAGIFLSLLGLSLEVRSVALPAKLLLFLVVDGWTLLVTGIVRSFGSGL
jgi:flagellar biosynthetic protein FliP